MTLLEGISWVFTAASIIGAVYNARAKILGFYIWIFANIGWVVYDALIKNYSQMALFIVYTFITAWGIYQWKRKKIK